MKKGEGQRLIVYTDEERKEKWKTNKNSDERREERKTKNEGPNNWLNIKNGKKRKNKKGHIKKREVKKVEER